MISYGVLSFLRVMVSQTLSLGFCSTRDSYFSTLKLYVRLLQPCLVLGSCLVLTAYSLGKQLAAICFNCFSKLSQVNVNSFGCFPLFFYLSMQRHSLDSLLVCRCMPLKSLYRSISSGSFFDFQSLFCVLLNKFQVSISQIVVHCFTDIVQQCAFMRLVYFKIRVFTCV